ncbi:hypothetical protein [Ensifer canadensis]|uniref:hypothetical protein n=1 Tax=Ensifer canadensis TaxID=555315 RepID=UPI001F37F17A|nr:hypothetical protein [Ensifer canadensis]
MNSKQKGTLAAVFKDPVSGTIEWAAKENLVVAAGANVIDGMVPARSEAGLGPLRTSFVDVLEEMKVAPTTKLLKLLELEIASCAHRWRRRPGALLAPSA